LTLGDVVLGISASGTTPFVLGAIEEAVKVGARTIGLTCDASSPLAESVEIAIAPQVGPEVVTGSTRMKGGLVQKMILSALSTSVMVRMGRVRGNHMTHVSPVSSKLRGRAVRIVMELGAVDRARAQDILRKTEGSVALALEILEAEGSGERG
jgi:N-acetylmuramic acid 6-phosphate etherase